MSGNLKSLFVYLAVSSTLCLAAGCGGRQLMLEERFFKIVVGQSNSTDVLNILPEEGMLHTAGSVCVLNKNGWAREVGLVQFSPTDSSVERKEYIQRTSRQIFPLLTRERIFLQIQTVVPDVLLEEPYENDLRRHTAILQYCHRAMIDDARPFTEDQETESYIGMARTALGVGIQKLSLRLRESDNLISDKGFAYDHPLLEKCHMRLGQDHYNIFTVTVWGENIVDPFTGW